jgi:hypothetical protein
MLKKVQLVLLLGSIYKIKGLMMNKKFIKHASDLRPLMFLRFAFLFLAAVIYGHYIAIIPFFICCISVIAFNHNHKHLATSDYKLINRMIDITSSIIMGRSASWVLITHNQNHNAHHGNKNDWMGTHLFADGFINYFIKSVKSVKENKQGVQAKLLQQYKRESSIEIKAIYIFILVTLLVNPLSLLIIVPTWILSNATLTLINLMQHHDCYHSKESIYYSCRNFTGKTFNYITFDSGFHTAHHLAPRLHWSNLREKHKSIEDQIPKELNTQNILKYIADVLTNDIEDDKPLYNT